MFQVSMRSDVGAFRSNVHTITRGLPRGGELSPVLWQLYFNDVPERLSQRREMAVLIPEDT